MTGQVTFTEGFDMYNGANAGIGLPVRWNQSSVGAWGVAGGRFSGQCLDFTGNSGSAGTIQTPGGQDASVLAVFDGTGLTTAMAHGFAFMVNSGRQDAIVDIQTAAGAQLFSVGVSGTGQIIVCTLAGGTVFTGSAGVVSSGTWYYMEIEATMSASVGTINVYLGGGAVCALTGLNTGTGAGIVQYREFGGGSTTLHRYVDDIYFVTGAATRLGERRIETLRATADISVTWTPNSGVTNFSRINETQVDGDTSFNSTSVVGNLDLYSIGSLSTTPTTIDCVTVVDFSDKTDANARTMNGVIKSGVVQSDGSPHALLSSYNRYNRLILADPATSAAWTASGVNNLLIGPKLAS